MSASASTTALLLMVEGSRMVVYQLLPTTASPTTPTIALTSQQLARSARVQPTSTTMLMARSLAWTHTVSGVSSKYNTYPKLHDHRANILPEPFRHGTRLKSRLIFELTEHRVSTGSSDPAEHKSSMSSASSGRLFLHG